MWRKVGDTSSATSSGESFLQATYDIFFSWEDIGTGFVSVLAAQESQFCDRVNGNRDGPLSLGSRAGHFDDDAIPLKIDPFPVQRQDVARSKACVDPDLDEVRHNGRSILNEARCLVSGNPSDATRRLLHAHRADVIGDAGSKPAVVFNNRRAQNSKLSLDGGVFHPGFPAVIDVSVDLGRIDACSVYPGEVTVERPPNRYVSWDESVVALQVLRKNVGYFSASGAALEGV